MELSENFNGHGDNSEADCGSPGDIFTTAHHNYGCKRCLVSRFRKLLAEMPRNVLPSLPQVTWSSMLFYIFHLSFWEAVTILSQALPNSRRPQATHTYTCTSPTPPSKNKKNDSSKIIFFQHNKNSHNERKTWCLLSVLLKP